jgi:hypothetical protein
MYVCVCVCLVCTVFRTIRSEGVSRRLTVGFGSGKKKAKKDYYIQVIHSFFDLTGTQKSKA